MVFIGNLSDLSPAQVLNIIDLSRKTGALRIFAANGHQTYTGPIRPINPRGDELATIYFRDGQIIMARLGEGDPYVANALLKIGKLSAAEAQAVRERCGTLSDKGLALTLINANYVTQEDVIHGVQQYALDVLYEVMTWTSEEFAFEENAEPPVDSIIVSVDLRRALSEGRRRTQEMKPLEDYLPDLDLALKFAPKVDSSFRGMQLSHDEWQVVSCVNALNTIRDIARLSNMTNSEIRRVVYGLLQLGLVELMPQMTQAQSGRSGRRGLSRAM